ncbi:hypothetical protein [Hydrogenophaga laconesensis]|uniref:DUF924 domain-containing protein n=1 Tax=Hydrogenophaga laconesensis TaxID=1805971 RepID=A0ABU1VH63_9BURK|nr:hypothetical protein [Hydrogenophaga laconesensis]MDR7096822.1 hypothetical protein [Hydrogenophaga laconesensis]
MDELTVQHVTPTTQALLRWWFEPRDRADSGGFLGGQRQVLLPAITAHEALDMAAPEPNRPAHRLALADAETQLHALLALLIWQLLNHLDARAAGRADPRFTDQFVLVASDAGTRTRLLCALCGTPAPDHPGGRDFDRSDLARLAPLLIPAERHAEVLGFARAHAGEGEEHLRKTAHESVIAITDDRLEALECMARLPNAMLFDDETRPPYRDLLEDLTIGPAWRRQLRRFASTRNGHGAQVVFTHPTHGDGRHRYVVSGSGSSQAAGPVRR